MNSLGMGEAPYNVIYDSDLIIRDRSTLASLSIFYERVCLPWMPPELVQTFYRLRQSCGRDGLLAVEVVGIHAPEHGEFQLNWDNEMRTLFQAEVLKRLPPPIEPSFDFKDEKELAAALEGLTPNLSVDKTALRMFYAARVVHHLRADLNAPRLFQIGGSPIDREVLKALLAQHAFSYVVPAIQSLEPDEILRVREKVRDTREGFSMHLQKLSREVEKRVSEGEQIDDIARYARSLVETEIAPDYCEFRRSLPRSGLAFGARCSKRRTRYFRSTRPSRAPSFGQMP